MRNNKQCARARASSEQEWERERTRMKFCNDIGSTVAFTCSMAISLSFKFFFFLGGKWLNETQTCAYWYRMFFTLFSFDYRIRAVFVFSSKFLNSLFILVNKKLCKTSTWCEIIWFWDLTTCRTSSSRWLNETRQMWMLLNNMLRVSVCLCDVLCICFWFYLSAI